MRSRRAIARRNAANCEGAAWSKACRQRAELSAYGARIRECAPTRRLLACRAVLVCVLSATIQQCRTRWQGHALTAHLHPARRPSTMLLHTRACKQTKQPQLQMLAARRGSRGRNRGHNAAPTQGSLNPLQSRLPLTQTGHWRRIGSPVSKHDSRRGVPARRSARTLWFCHRQRSARALPTPAWSTQSTSCGTAGHSYTCGAALPLRRRSATTLPPAPRCVTACNPSVSPQRPPTAPCSPRTAAPRPAPPPRTTPCLGSAVSTLPGTCTANACVHNHCSPL